MQHSHHSFLSAQPPACDNGTTNSFVYCLILLHAAGLLHHDCAMGWCHAVPWFEALCRRLSLELYDVSHLAQAFAELLEISGTLPNAQEATAVAQLRHLSAQHPPGSRLGLRCIIPSITDEHGHVPNMLQDLWLQIFAGLQLASELDTAVSSFRCQGSWPSLLQPLQAAVLADPPRAHATEPIGEAHDQGEGNRSPAHAFDPLQLFPTQLHQHACVQRRSAQCGSRRRCRICNSQIPHQTLYFHCSQNCRFTVCSDCFRSNDALASPILEQQLRVVVQVNHQSAGAVGITPMRPGLTHHCHLLNMVAPTSRGM